MALENIEYGAKASSDVLNSNFNYLDERITTTNQKLETVDSQIQTAVASANSNTDTQISSLTSTLNSKVSSLQNSINSVKSTANSKLSSSSGSCWVRFSNGLIFQWGEWYRARDYGTYTITLPRAFASTNYQIAVSSNYKQTAGDKGASVAIFDKTTTYFTYRNAYEQSGATTRWLAFGW